MTYSENKGGNLVKVTVLITASGKIEAWSGISPGSEADSTIWNSSSILQNMVDNAETVLPCILMMDKGYDSIRVPQGTTALMPTKCGSAQFTLAENEHTRLVASHRVTIECVFGVIKQQWSIFMDQQPLSSFCNLEAMLFIVLCLYNMWNDHRK